MIRLFQGFRTPGAWIGSLLLGATLLAPVYAHADVERFHLAVEGAPAHENGLGEVRLRGVTTGGDRITAPLQHVVALRRVGEGATASIEADVQYNERIETLRFAGPVALADETFHGWQLDPSDAASTVPDREGTEHPIWDAAGNVHPEALEKLATTYPSSHTARARVMARGGQLHVEPFLPRALELRKALRGDVIGQDEAVDTIVDALMRYDAGLNDPNRPIGSFVFTGPHGVGKTELAKALARHYMGDERAMTRVDMSEYNTAESVKRFTGADPGLVGYNEGGVLTNAVLSRPRQVILLDEVEKAHPDVLRSLMGVIDDGRMTDGQGRLVMFNETILVLTTNALRGLQQKVRSQHVGFAPVDETPVVENHAGADDEDLRAELRQVPGFLPELVDRPDRLVMFNRLTPATMPAIVELRVDRMLRQRLAARGVHLVLTENAVRYLAEVGHREGEGARMLNRTIQRLVSDPIAFEATAGHLPEGSTAHVDVENDQIAVRAMSAEEAAAHEARQRARATRSARTRPRAAPRAIGRGLTNGRAGIRTSPSRR